MNASKPGRTADQQIEEIAMQRLAQKLPAHFADMKAQVRREHALLLAMIIGNDNPDATPPRTYDTSTSQESEHRPRDLHAARNQRNGLPTKGMDHRGEQGMDAPDDFDQR